MIYRLIVLTGPLKGQRITVDPEPMTIGREDGASVVLPDDEVAMRHAQLEQRGEALFVHDLGTMNKIILNKREIQAARLKHGDILELGRTRLLVQAVVQAEVQSAPNQAIPHIHRGGKRKLAVAASILLIAGVAFALIHTLSSSDHELTDSTELPPVIDFISVNEPPSETPDDETTLATGEEKPAIDSELRRIREDISFIQEHLRNINNSAQLAAAEDDGSEPSTELTVDGVNIDSIESIMSAVQKAMAASDFAQADLLLDHMRIEHPDYLPAYEARAHLYEAWGLPGKAREQWTSILQRTVESDLYRKAHAERIRLSRAESQRLISAHDAVRIHSIDQTRFRETVDYDEMRTVTIRLNYNRDLGPIDPDGVRLLVYFFEQDIDTRQIALSHLQPYTEANMSALHHDIKDQFTFSVSYVVPKGYYQRDHNTSRQRYFGFIARLHYFDRLVDEHARPPKLLEPAILEAAGLALHTARTDGAVELILNPASN